MSLHHSSFDPETQKNNRKDGFKMGAKGEALIVDNYGVSSSICRGSSPNAKTIVGLFHFLLLSSRFCCPMTSLIFTPSVWLMKVYNHFSKIFYFSSTEKTNSQIFINLENIIITPPNISSLYADRSGRIHQNVNFLNLRSQLSCSSQRNQRWSPPMAGNSNPVSATFLKLAHFPPLVR